MYVCDASLIFLPTWFAFRKIPHCNRQRGNYWLGPQNLCVRLKHEVCLCNSFRINMTWNDVQSLIFFYQPDTCVKKSVIVIAKESSTWRESMWIKKPTIAENVALKCSIMTWNWRILWYSFTNPLMYFWKKRHYNCQRVIDLARIYLSK